MPYRFMLMRDEIHCMGQEMWGRGIIIKVPATEVQFCEKEEVDSIFLEICKKNLVSNILGWNEEKAKKLENKGKEYIINEVDKILNTVPTIFFEVCKQGNFGFSLKFSNISLPNELQMKEKLCSDNQVRNNDLEYIKYLLGDEWDIKKVCEERWPKYKFTYVKESEYRKLQDIWCIAPFAAEIDEIRNSALL